MRLKTRDLAIAELTQQLAAERKAREEAAGIIEEKDNRITELNDALKRLQIIGDEKDAEIDRLEAKVKVLRECLSEWRKWYTSDVGEVYNGHKTRMQLEEMTEKALAATEAKRGEE